MKTVTLFAATLERGVRIGATPWFRAASDDESKLIDSIDALKPRPYRRTRGKVTSLPASLYFPDEVSSALKSHGIIATIHCHSERIMKDGVYQ
jgi:hypothetical protein